VERSSERPGEGFYDASSAHLAGDQLMEGWVHG
jgi:hypothetical protein